MPEKLFSRRFSVSTGPSPATFLQDEKEYIVAAANNSITKFFIFYFFYG